MKVHQKVRIKIGKMPCSDFRPHQGEVGEVTRIFPGQTRYSICVQFPNKDWGAITYHPEELDVLE